MGISPKLKHDRHHHRRSAVQDKTTSAPEMQQVKVERQSGSGQLLLLSTRRKPHPFCLDRQGTNGAATQVEIAYLFHSSIHRTHIHSAGYVCMYVCSSSLSPSQKNTWTASMQKKKRGARARGGERGGVSPRAREGWAEFTAKKTTPLVHQRTRKQQTHIRIVCMYVCVAEATHSRSSLLI